jgi:chemotaxis protein CheD
MPKGSGPYVTASSQPPLSPALAANVPRKRLSLGLGAVVIVETPTVVRTVLGSCVAVILHVPRLQLSALCHAQMPERQAGVCCGESCPHPCSTDIDPDSNELRYVSCCIRYMLDELHRRHVGNSEIVCTLVGGANVLRNLDARWSVASRNVDMATDILERERIRIAYADTGGTQGRVIQHTCDLNRTEVRYHGAL